MAFSFRRLAKDHAALQSCLPPNFLFPETDDGDLPDDLTQLLVLVTGSEGTPYSGGLWRLHLKIPHDYPKSPPKATFKTRIYHPNVEESTGAVCLETLKRDWDQKLTLKDILVTISCLLIQPNPDSALNSAAGALIQEDYAAFSTQARLMTSIHAPIPKNLFDAVREAKRRGEQDADDSQWASPPISGHAHQESIEKDDMKENELVPASLVLPAENSAEGNINGKRPISQLASPSASQSQEGPKRSSPRFMRGSTSDETFPSQVVVHEDEKENISSKFAAVKQSHVPHVSLASRPTALRKVSNVGAGRRLPRVGIRRL